MAWWDSLFGDGDGGSSDNSWWGYVAAAASEYADDEKEKKKDKMSFKQRKELLLLQDRLAREEKEREGKLLSDAYSNYSQFYKPTASASGQSTNPLQAFNTVQQKPKGLLTYGG